VPRATAGRFSLNDAPLVTSLPLIGRQGPVIGSGHTIIQKANNACAWTKALALQGLVLGAHNCHLIQNRVERGFLLVRVDEGF